MENAIYDRNDVLLLFSLNGTLTPPNKSISKSLYDFFRSQVKPCATLGIISGCDITKIRKQLGDNFMEVFDYVFAENGAVQYVYGSITGKENILSFLGERKYQTFINYVLGYLSGLALPFKRGNFIELRSGIVNICPIGRDCTTAERETFEMFDNVNGTRAKMIECLKSKFDQYGLQYAIGGQISIDVFPETWDKTFCLQFVKKGDRFKQVHFFGSKTNLGENDYEIMKDSRVIGHKVTSPSDTKQQVEELIDTL